MIACHECEQHLDLVGYDDVRCRYTCASCGLAHVFPQALVLEVAEYLDSTSVALLARAEDAMIEQATHDFYAGVDSDNDSA